MDFFEQNYELRNLKSSFNMHSDKLKMLQIYVGFRRLTADHELEKTHLRDRWCLCKRILTSQGGMTKTVDRIYREVQKLHVPDWLPRQTTSLNSGLKSYLVGLYSYMANSSKQIQSYTKSLDDVEKNISGFRESLMTFRNKVYSKLIPRSLTNFAI